MFFAILTMITALAISAVAIYYSVAGLAAIFAAAVIPIIIMGSVLEGAKLVTAVWLHKYWDKAAWWLKTYLAFAVAVLMLITSMGIFGFLSKAHIEQTSLSVEQGALIEQIDQSLLRSQLKIDRWNEETDKLLSGEDVRVDNLVEREQEEIDKLYDRLEREKTQARDDAQANIALQNNRLSQAQTRKEQDIANAQQRYAGAFADKDALDEAIQRATQNELSVASAVQRQIVSINGDLNQQITSIDEKYAPQIAAFQDRINELRNQSNNETQDIDARLDELDDLLTQEQNSVAELRQEKAVLETQYRQLEAEVGPIKYIAEFVYGEEANKNLLEEAVRWVIITIIFVFDPLAVLLLIASQYTFNFHKQEAIDKLNGDKDEHSDSDTAEHEHTSTAADDADDASSTEQLDYAIVDNSSDEPSLGGEDTRSGVSLQSEWAANNQQVEQDQHTNIEDVDAQEIVKSYADIVETVGEVQPVEKKELKSPEELKREAEYDLKEQDTNFQVSKTAWKDAHPGQTLKHYKNLYVKGLIDSLPWEQTATDDNYNTSEGYQQNAEQSDNTLFNKLSNK